MVIHSDPSRRRAGALTTELLVAMAIFVIAIVPLALSILKEQRMARILYYRVVAGSILDGELEILLAGEWRAVPEGTQALEVNAEAARSLPAGVFTVTREGRHLALEWQPAKRLPGGESRREAIATDSIDSTVPTVAPPETRNHEADDRPTSTSTPTSSSPE